MALSLLGINARAMTDPAALAEAIEDEVGTVLVGQDDLVECLTIYSRAATCF